MVEKKETNLIPQKRIEDRIFLIRGKKVMLDRDLAELYKVETRALNQAVKRNIKRFPDDFMFQLTNEETKNWISQIVISNKERMGLRKNPLVFTEMGVAMLSSVIKSERAIQVNIQIMRTFTRIREILLTHKDLKKKIENLEKKYEQHNDHFKVVFEAIKRLLEEKEKPKNKLGFLK